MASHVGVYVEQATGHVAFVVVVRMGDQSYDPTDEDYAPHDKPGFIRVNVPIVDAAQVEPVNIDGRASFHVLESLVVDYVATVDADCANLMRANIAAAVARLAEIATKKTAFANFVSSLSPDQIQKFDANVDLTSELTASQLADYALLHAG